MKLVVHVIPRSSKNEIVGTQPDGSLKVKLMAVPEGGVANTHLIELLRRHFDVKKQSIRILKGHTRRKKLIEIDTSSI